MSQIKCALTPKQLNEFHEKIRGLIEKNRPDNVPEFIFNTLAKIEGKVPGITEQYKEALKTQSSSFVLNQEETERLDTFVSRLVKDAIPDLDSLSQKERLELFDLLNKASMTAGYDPAIVGRLQQLFYQRKTAEVDQVYSVIEVLESQREHAENIGDTKTIQKIDKALQALKRSAEIQANLDIDFNAVEDAFAMRHKLAESMALLDILKQVIDGSFAAQRNKTLQKQIQIGEQVRNIRRQISQVQQSDTLTEDEIEAEVVELQEQLAKLQANLEQIQNQLDQQKSKQTQKRQDLIETRERQLKLKIQEFDVSNVTAEQTTLLMLSRPEDSSEQLISARDFLTKKAKVSKNIKFLTEVFEKDPEDKTYSKAELERLFGSDANVKEALEAAFIETIADEVTKKNVHSQKDFISKKDALEIFDLWKITQEESVFDPGIDKNEAEKLASILRNTERESIVDVDPDAPQPIARTRQEAQETTPGYKYDATKEEDRELLVADVQEALGRLNTLSKMGRFGGNIPEWALVSALGSRGQSLFPLFDGARLNPQSIFYREDSQRFVVQDDHQRRSIFTEMMVSTGIEDIDIQAMPEMQDGFKDDFRNLSGVSFIKNKDNKIIGVSLSNVYHEPTDSNTTKEVRYISSSDGAGKPLTQQDAANVLDLIEEQMNSGVKIIMHGALIPDGSLEALILQAQDARKGLRVAVRAYDLGLMAFKASRGTEYGPYNHPSLASIVQALGVGVGAFPTQLDIDEAVNLGINGEIEKLAHIQSTAMYEALMAIGNRNNVELSLKSSTGKTTTLQFGEVSTLWQDGNGSPHDMETNHQYAGLSHLFEIQVFGNLRAFNGHGIQKTAQYDLAKVQAITTQLLILGIKEIDPNQVNNVLNGLVSMPSQLEKHYQLVMRLSKQNHAGYMPLKVALWKQNNQRFIISEQVESNGRTTYQLDSSPEAYAKETIAQAFDTWRKYFKKPEVVMNEVATLIGFRQQQENESTEAYFGALFRAVNKEFNGQDYSIVDFGNAKFDYISARQLGRGFAQAVLGFVKEGSTLTQNIDTPLTAAEQLKENLALENETTDITSVEQEIQKRSFLPLTRDNVSYYSPLSMYEQERTFSDWALRKRFQHILGREITPEDRLRFDAFMAENRIIEYRNKIQTFKQTINSLQQELQKDPKNQEIIDKITQANVDKAAAIQEFREYMDTLDERRLEQGRVQLYHLINPFNNRSLFTRIPSADEALNMSLEVAMEIPQLVATYVHDSRNYIDGSEMHLQESTYMADPAKSGGGPGGRSTLAGIHSLAAFLVMYPQKFRMSDADFDQQINSVQNNPYITPEEKTEVLKRLGELRKARTKRGFVNITSDILSQTLAEGYKARQEGMAYSKSTYFDDKFSGIHHLLAAQLAFLPNTRTKTLAQELILLKSGKQAVTEDELKDYYEATFTATLEHTDQLEKRIRVSPRFSPEQKQSMLRSLSRVKRVLQSNFDPVTGKPSSDGRTFFKGVVIPIIYSGGVDAVIKDLKNRRASSPKSGDPDNPNLGDLTDADLEALAQGLAGGAGTTDGRMIDEIMDLDPKNQQKLVDVLLSRTDALTGNSLTTGNSIILSIDDIQQSFANAVDEHENVFLLRSLIDARIEYVARLTVKPSDVKQLSELRGDLAKVPEQEAFELLVQEKATELKAKWSKRIDDAIARLQEHNTANNVPINSGFVLESEIGKEVQEILAGGKGQYLTQASLLFLNKVQASGYNVVANDETILEHQIKNGRYISPDDLMYQNYVVFASAAFGTSTYRMQYPGNYLTNLQGGSLSKGLRKAYKDNGELDLKDSVLGSMWKLTNNPFEKLSRDQALAKAKDLQIKNFALMLATDYDPEFFEYDRETSENREQFFRDWQARSEAERVMKNNLGPGSARRAEFKRLYLEQQRRLGVAEDKLKDITDAQIDEAIASNSVPFDNREGIRLFAPDLLTDETGVLVPQHDAKGLGAFIPRIADHDIKDHGIHGLYTIHHGIKRLQTQGGLNLINFNKANQEDITLQSTLSGQPEGSSIYDADNLPFIPQSSASLPELLLDHEPHILDKAANLKHRLDTFAFQNGYDELVRTKDYARLYQIYRIFNHMRQAAFRSGRLSSKNGQSREFRMEFRNMMLRVFQLTKVQRDAKNRKQSILDIGRTLAIDPSKFKYANGTNMHYLDVLKTLADMGVDELATLDIGLFPVEMHTLGTEAVDVLNKEQTIVKPFYVQGHDVALLIMETLAHDVFKREATKAVNDEVAAGRFTATEDMFDAQGFVILSKVPAGLADTVINKALQNETLVDAAVNDLNLYITLDWSSQETKASITSHADTLGKFVIPGQGVQPIVNYSRVGPQQARFMLTAEAAKRILLGARNSRLFSRIETAVQANKFIGERTNLSDLRAEAFREIGDQRSKEAAEDVEVLSLLMGPDNPLRLLVTQGMSAIRDEYGLSLNPYDAEFYFNDRGLATAIRDAVPHYRNMNPFMAALTAPIHRAIEVGRHYPILDAEVQILDEFLNGTNPKLAPIGFYIFLKYTTKDLTDNQYRTLMEEITAAVEITEEEFNELKSEAEKIIAIMDKVLFVPKKGKNPYLSLAAAAVHDLLSSHTFAFTELRADIIADALPDIPNKNYKSPQTRNFQVATTPDELKKTDRDRSLKVQAAEEAIQLYKFANQAETELYPHIDTGMQLAVAFDPSEIHAIIPGAEGQRITEEIDALVSRGTISKSTAVFYRYMVIRIAKTNPNLLPLLSITDVDSDSVMAGLATNANGKFKITLNSNILKKMGTIDQVRVFAHEMAHIARLAFIRDNSKEYKRLMSLFRSKKGRDAISTMLLAMNGNKKYQGFEADVESYLKDPEEFIAAWGAWMLFQKTFAAPELRQVLQGRNRAAFEATQLLSSAVNQVSQEVVGIALGLNQLDEGLRNELFDVMDNMFGFTAENIRNIHVDNQEQTLFRIENILAPLTEAEIIERQNLQQMAPGTLSTTQTERLETLNQRFSSNPLQQANHDDIIRARQARINAGNDFSVENIDKAGELEIIETVLSSVLQQTHTNARANHTFGGMTRNIAESIFGVERANRIMNARHFLIMGVGSRYTYDNSNPLISGVMHLISDTLGMYAYQFETLDGARGIRESRFHTKRMLERITYETDLLMGVARDKVMVEQAKAEAVVRAMDPTRTSTTFEPEVDAQINRLAIALRENSVQLKRFVYGSYADRLETLPTMLDPTQLGLDLQGNSRARRQQRDNREAFETELTTMIRNNILNGEIDGTVLYVMGLIPQRTDIDSVNNFLAQHRPIFMEMQPTIATHLAALKGIDVATAQTYLSDAITRNFVPPPNSAYTQSEILSAVQLARNEVIASASVGSLARLGPGLNTAIRNAAQAQINTPVAIPTDLLNPGNQSETHRLPIMKVGSANVFTNISLQGTAPQVLARLFLSHASSGAHYFRTNEFMNLNKLLANPRTAQFVNPNIAAAVTQVERQQGYHRLSERAIENMTGVQNVSIFDLISLLRTNVNALGIPPAEQSNFLKSLDVISLKLEVDQGLALHGKGASPVWNLMAKYGPDVVRMVHGSNLNTASLMVEGTMGFVITSLYGGDPMRFLSSVFKAFLPVKHGRFNLTSLEQRGAAVNLLLGMERSIQEQRDSAYITDTVFGGNTGYVERLRNWLRQSNNRGMNAIQSGLAEQGQWIFLKKLQQGHIDTLIRVVNTDRPRNLTELKDALTRAGVSRWQLNPHFAFIVMQSGMLQPNVLKAYRALAREITTKNTIRKRPGRLNLSVWGVDTQAAGRFLETAPRTAGGTSVDISGDTVEIADAQRAIEATYFINKEFTNIVAVDANAFDAATATNPFEVLYYFYKQYPNLFTSQKMFRLAGRMDKVDFAALLISNMVMDVIYNLLLQVASGVIPLAALVPFSDEWIGNKMGWNVLRTIISRNPIFSPTVNYVANGFAEGVNAASRIKENKYQNRVTQLQAFMQGALRGMLEPAFVPLDATVKLAGDLTTIGSALALNHLDLQLLGIRRGNLNDQEYWDVMDKSVRMGLRMFPGTGLPLRVFGPEIVRELFNDRPVRLPLKPVGAPPFATPGQPLVPSRSTTKTSSATSSLQRAEERARKNQEPPRARNPIPIPKGLMR